MLLCKTGVLLEVGHPALSGLYEYSRMIWCSYLNTNIYVGFVDFQVSKTSPTMCVMTHDQDVPVPFADSPGNMVCGAAICLVYTASTAGFCAGNLLCAGCMHSGRVGSQPGLGQITRELHNQIPGKVCAAHCCCSQLELMFFQAQYFWTCCFLQLLPMLSQLVANSGCGWV